MNPRNVFATTTSTLDGWVIKEYFAVISAHVVAGTNVFSDFAASLSDIFGGRSKSYQKQLVAIDNEVISELKQKAAALGANCILGLRIDHDSISSQGKSMFMVTASGTAAFGRRVVGHSDEESIIAEVDRYTKTDIQAQIRRNELIEQARNTKLALDEELIGFLIQNRVSELSHAVTNVVEQDFISDSLYQSIVLYYTSIASQIAKDSLYSALETEGLSLEVLKRLTNIIHDANLIDYARILSLLEGESLSGHKVSLRLLNFYSDVYGTNDIENLERIYSLLDMGFPKRAERFMKKTLLTGKENEHWKCVCGNTQAVDYSHCTKCGSDPYGFNSHDPSIDKTKKSVLLQLNALKQLYSAVDVSELT